MSMFPLEVGEIGEVEEGEMADMVKKCIGRGQGGRAGFRPFGGRNNGIVNREGLNVEQMALRARADQSNRFNPFNDPNIRQIEVLVIEQGRVVNVEGQKNVESGSPKVEEGEIPLAEETVIVENLAREEELELEPRHEQSDVDGEKLDGNLIESLRNVESQKGQNHESDVEENSHFGEIRER